eukprot:53948-Rhodomonas_salina.3
MPGTEKPYAGTRREGRLVLHNADSPTRALTSAGSARPNQMRFQCFLYLSVPPERLPVFDFAVSRPLPSSPYNASGTSNALPNEYLRCTSPVLPTHFLGNLRYLLRMSYGMSGTEVGSGGTRCINRLRACDNDASDEAGKTENRWLTRRSFGSNAICVQFVPGMRLDHTLAQYCMLHSTIRSLGSGIPTTTACRVPGP